MRRAEAVAIVRGVVGAGIERGGAATQFAVSSSIL